MSESTKSPYGFSIRRIPEAEQQPVQAPAAEKKEAKPPQPPPVETPKQEEKPEKLLHCSFCGKNQHEVRKLVAGPSVYICNECTDLCVEIIAEETRQDSDEVSISAEAESGLAAQSGTSSGGYFYSPARVLSCVSAIAGSHLVQEVTCRRSPNGEWWIGMVLPVEQVAHIIWTAGGQPFTRTHKQWLAVSLSGDSPNGRAETLDVDNWEQVELSDLLAGTALHPRPLTGMPEVHVVAPPALSQWILRRASSLGVRVGMVAAMSAPLHQRDSSGSGVLLLRLRMENGDVPLSLVRAIAKLPYTLVTRPVGLDGNRLLVDVNFQAPLSDALLGSMVPAQETWVLGAPELGHWRLLLQGNEVDGSTLLDAPTLEMMELPDGEAPKLPEAIPVRIIQRRDNGRIDAVLLDDQELDWVRLFMANRPAGEAAFILPGAGKHLFTSPGGLSGVLPFGIPLTHLRPGGLFLEAGLDFYPALPETARKQTFRLDEETVVVVTQTNAYRFRQVDMFPAWALWVGEVMDAEVGSISERTRMILARLDADLRRQEAGNLKMPLPPSWMGTARKLLGMRGDAEERPRTDRGASLEQAQRAELAGDFVRAAEIMEQLGNMPQAGRLYEKAANKASS